MLLHASLESGICARKAWGSRRQKARTATDVCFHLPSQATLRALPSLPRKVRHSFEQKITEITEAVMFIKNVYEMACKETWSIATPLIAADYSSHTGFFNRKVSSCYIQRHRIFSAGAKILRIWPVFIPVTWNLPDLPVLHQIHPQNPEVTPSFPSNSSKQFAKSLRLRPVLHQFHPRNSLKSWSYGKFGISFIPVTR